MKLKKMGSLAVYKYYYHMSICITNDADLAGVLIQIYHKLVKKNCGTVVLVLVPNCTEAVG